MKIIVSLFAISLLFSACQSVVSKAEEKEFKRLQEVDKKIVTPEQARRILDSSIKSWDREDSLKLKN